jgi:glycerophosphoryl diester phosphodiesterase
MPSHNFTVPRLIGHRGIAARAPENTLISFRRAFEAGVKWVEFDVMLTADGVPIVIHDPSLKRTTQTRGRVGKLNYADVAHLDAGSWFSPEFKGEKIPRFEEVIALLGELNLQANVEIKPYWGADRETAECVLQEIHDKWPKHLPAPLISSFSFEAMKIARDLAADLPRGLCLSRWSRHWQYYANELACSTVHLPVSAARADRIREVHETGRGVIVYTVNDPNQARELYALGVDGIFSDCPDEIASIVPSP